MLNSNSKSPRPLLEGLEPRQHLAADPLTLSIVATDNLASEVGPSIGTFTITRTGSVAKPMTVYIKTRGSATLGTDYVALGDYVVLRRNRTAVTVNLTPFADQLLENGETVTMQIAPVAGYTITKAKAEVLIEDNPPGVASSYTWAATTKPDTGHVEPESAMVNGKVYLFSGYQGTYAPSPRVDVFDIATQKWTRLKDMPTPTTHAATTVVGTDVWFAGGYTLRPGTTDKQDTYSKNVWRYDTLTDKWHAGVALPDYRGSSGMVHFGRKLYLVAGDDRYRLTPRTELFVLDLDNSSAGWKKLAPIPQGRSHFGIVELNGFIYVIGGQKGIDETSSHFKTAYRYNIAKDTWTQIADLPTVLSHISISTFVYKGRIVVVGGETHFNGSVKNVREYNPATNTWRELTPLPLARAAGAGHVWNNTFFFTGGKDNNFGRDTWLAKLS